MTNDDHDNHMKRENVQRSSQKQQKLLMWEIR